MFFVFFFSSRRRHTRCSRDWSSDVCSSDLVVGDVAAPGAYDISSLSTALNALFASGGVTPRGSLRALKHYRGKQLVETVDAYRSEERRVGKECRSRWSPYH